MTDKEKARAYDEAKERMRAFLKEWENCGAYGEAMEKARSVFPELRESEDEKVRKEIIEVLQLVPSSMWEQAKTDYERCFAYLEKQKYDRMKPIYDNQESFESALDKAWKSYNDSGARTVDGCEDNYTECAHAKGFREGYLFGLGKYKDLDKMIVVSPEVWDNAISDAYENGKKDGEKQKEPHYTKRNALFDKCVENCDPEVMKSVSDKIDEMLEKEQKPEEFTHHETNESLKDAVTHQMEDDGDVDDFVRRGIDDIALKYAKLGVRWQKEQKPAEWSEEDEKMRRRAICACNFTIRELSGSTHYEEARDWLKSLPIGFIANPQYNSDMVNLLVGELQTIAKDNGVPKLYDMEISWLKSLCPQSKQEWSEEDEKSAYFVNQFLGYHENADPTAMSCKKWFNNRLKSLRPQPKPEWSEEDEKDIAHIIRILDDCYAYGKHDLSKTDHDNLTSMIKSLRPVSKDSLQSWKPTEEQMEALDEYIYAKDPNTEKYSKAVLSLRDELKELM